MIVFDLRCERGNHVFEGWFSSTADFDSQLARGMLSCPLCGDAGITKAVMAPAVGAKGNQKASDSRSTHSDHSGQAMMSVSGQPGDAAETGRTVELLKALAKAQAAALANSEWVGPGFADRARAMHYGEEEARPIHGQVAAGEARGLVEEGIEVAPLLFPVVPPEANN